MNLGGSATVLNFGGGATAAEFRFLEPSGSGTNYSAFKAVAQAANMTYSLPPSLVAGGALTDVAGNGVLTWVVPSGGGGGSPGGSGSEIQYRSGASTFGAVTGSSVSGGQVALMDFATISVDTATTSSAVKVLDLQVSSTGTPAAGFGGKIRWGGESSTTLNRDMLEMQGIWATATDGSRSAVWDLYAVTAAGALERKMRIGDMGIGAGYWGIGFLGGIDASNYALLGDGTNLVINAQTSISVRINNSFSPNALTIDSSNRLGLNLSSAIGAQFHAVSGSASRVGLRIDSAASPTASIARFTVNGGANTGVEVSEKSSIDIYNGAAPTASVTDGVRLYSEDVSASAELKVRDEAGNITTLSPHNFSAIPQGKSEKMSWAFYSERDGKIINVDMLRVVRLLEKLTGEKLVHIGVKK